MKLIDILVQELPKRGGWPEGVARLAQDPDGDLQKLSNRDAWFMSGAGWNGDGREDFFGEYIKNMSIIAEDHATAIVTRGQYEAALKQSVWDGTSLPPVGVECEWQDKNTKKWVGVLVVYASEWVTVIRENEPVDPVELAIENYGDEARRKFRPVRSERGEAIDELASTICGDIPDTGMATAVMYATRIYDAGYRKLSD